MAGKSLNYADSNVTLTCSKKLINQNSSSRNEGCNMKHLLFLFAFLFLSVSVNAQSVEKLTETTPTPNVTSTKKEDKSKTKDDPTPTKNKFNLPPEKLNPIVAPKFTTSPNIDGKLDDEFWKTAAVFKDFYQTNPGDNIAPSKPTEAYLGFTPTHLYVAFRCWDEPDKVRATLAKRDEIFGEDNVRFWLDTYDDQRRAYVIGLNPFGIQQDGIFTENQGADFSVDIVMESKGTMLPDGWSVEVAIPFKSLRYAAGKGKKWGINFARNIDRFNDEFDQWMPNDRNNASFLSQFGKITGLEGIKVERTLEIVPSVTLSQTGERIEDSRQPNGQRFLQRGVKREFGVNIKYSITPNITLDAAINPDFAEIEADATVVTANQRFPIFFEEKRPFFLEGADIFQSPIQVFYSRTIVDPDLAAKLTGKVGKNSFGLLVATDNAPGNYSEDERNDPNIRPRIDEFLDKNANFAVLRLKRDVGKENSIGFFGTARMFPEQRNFLGGFDGRFKLNASTVMQFQVVGTHSRRCFFENSFEPLVNPTAAIRNREVCNSTYNRYRTGNGFAYYANYDYSKKNHGFFAEIGGRTKFYRADAGFTRRTNTNFAFAGFRRSTEPKPKAKIIRASWFNGFGLDYDFQGRVTSATWNTNLNLNLQKNTFINANGGISRERLLEEEFGLKRAPSRPNGGAFFGDSERSATQGWASFNINSQLNKKFAYGVFAGTIWNAFDFDFGGGPRFPRVSPAAMANPNAALDPGPGQQYDFGAGIEWKPINPFRFSLEYNKSKLVRHDTKLTAFDSNIVSLRSTYQFTRFTFVRARWDYDSISSNIRGQMLLGWTPNPGTALYIGYNDDFNYNGFNPFTGALEPRFERNGRTFFIRMSYLFRKSF